MKRHLVILAALALLALPISVGAEESAIPPELNWSAYPPARETVDSEVAQLMEVLVKKGVITLQDLSRLVQPELATAARESRGMTLESGTSDRTSR